ncbi:uncharacterized protein LOC110067145 isoform X2 [Orbicella faveolata]|nr:uncharacterized protein LOC110067145 isoform X2 [Orbicella faveolata]
MSVDELSYETVEELCGALERGPSVTWKALMESTVFRSIYTEKVAPTIQCSKDLLTDMAVREIKLPRLVDGLREIGNKKAVSIIMRGIQFLGGRPPPGWNLERRELAGTLPHPVQESGKAAEGADRPSMPRFETSVNVIETMISTFFPCFTALFRQTP